MTWGEQNSEAEAHAQIDWALGHGINFIDTAEMYPIPPAAEDAGRDRAHRRQLAGEEQGEAREHRHRLQDRRPRAARVDPQRREPRHEEDHPVGARGQPEAPADRLHRPVPDPLARALRALVRRLAVRPVARSARKRRSSSRSRRMAALIKAGKDPRLRPVERNRLGPCASSRGWRSENGLPPPASVQNGYSLVNRMFDGDLAEASRRCKVPLLAYSALAMGLLTGKMKAKPWPAETRLQKFPDFGERYKRPRVLAAAAEYQKLAREARPAARRHRARVREEPLLHRLDDPRRDFDGAAGRACGVF